MKKIIGKIFFGSDSKVSGVIAFTVIAFIGLGCFCKKDGFDFSKTGQTNSPRRENQNSSVPFSPASNQRTSTFSKADASKNEIPSENELREMAKTTLLDFNEAIQGEDFTTFYGNISLLWQKQTTPEKLKEIFKIFIVKKVDLAAVASLEANFSSNPRVDDSKGFKELVLDGRYDTSPLPTKFTLKYTPEGREWKLTGIVVDTTP